MVCRKHYVVFECLVLNCVFVDKKVLKCTCYGEYICCIYVFTSKWYIVKKWQLSVYSHTKHTCNLRWSLKKKKGVDFSDTLQIN